MQLDVTDEWILVKKKEEPLETKKKKGLSVALLILSVAVAVAIIALVIWLLIVINDTGVVLPVTDLGVWDDIILAVVFGASILIFYLAFRKCHNILSLMIVALVVGLSVMVSVSLVIVIVLDVIFLSTATGDLYFALSIRVALDVMCLVMSILLIAFFASLELKGAKLECDIVSKGRDLPSDIVSSPDGKTRSSLDCKELKGNKMCKVSSITGIRE